MTRFMTVLAAAAMFASGALAVTNEQMAEERFKAKYGRYTPAEEARRKLAREFAAVKTAYGEVTVKLGKLDGKVIQESPEFESCKKLARTAKVPLKTIYESTATALKRQKKR